MSLRLGPFELRSVLASGAAGEVWRATHEATAVEVAVKVLRGARASEERYRRALRQEIRAMARLDHPAVVAIVDHGEVGPDEAGRLPEGAPWLAMELVPGGSLYPRSGALSWEQVRRIARSLLGALGHAHARGVLHRDVKPANVLLVSEDTLRVVLTDFGVAHPIARGAPAGPAVAGTPGFMAPEQREGRWRDFGPWTDLYGLGRTVEFLLRGKQGHTPDVPEGYAAWMGHLLAEEPAHRFRMAADALAGLEVLGPPTVPLGAAPTTSGAHSTFFDLDLPPEEDTPTAARTVAPTVDAGRWHPEAWQSQRRALAPAGMRLAMLRVPPLVGRGVEREQLWAALGAVREEPRVVLLRGAPGVGKSRLARWLAETAFEAGMAGPVVALRSEPPAAGDGLRGALARLLGFAMLGPGEVARRAREVIRLWGLEDERAEPVLTGVFGGGAPLGSSERVRGLSAILGWLAAQRSLVLVIDGAEQAREDVTVLAALVAEGAPVLGLCVCREAPDWLRDALPAHEELGLGPPDAATHRALVRGLLPLDPALVGQITDHTLGEPRRALALVRDLAERQLLRPGRDGFTLVGSLQAADGGERARLERFLAGRGEVVEVALELCAVSGAVVDPDEHDALLAAWGLAPEEGWLDDAAEAGLLRVEADGGWLLADGMREALRARASEAGRLERAHQVRAVVLERGGGERGVVGLHLSEAGALARALVLLEEGVREDLGVGAFHRARQWIREWRRAADRAGLAPEDPRRGELALLDLVVDLARDRFDALDAGLDALASRASAAGWPAVTGGVMWLRGRSAYLRGRPQEARRWLERSLVDARERGDTKLLAPSCADLARTENRFGDSERVEPLLREAWAAYEELDHASGKNLVAGELVDLRLTQGDVADARRWVGVAAETAAEVGGASNLADAALLRGEVARAAGDFDEAEARYREAMRHLATSVQFEHLDSIQLNLALLAAERGDWAAGMARAEQCIDTFEADSREWLLAAAHVVALAPAAGLGDRSALSRSLVRAESLLVRTGFVAADVIRALELAEAQVQARGWDGERATLRRLSEEQRRAIGRG